MGHRRRAAPPSRPRERARRPGDHQPARPGAHHGGLPAPARHPLQVDQTQRLTRPTRRPESAEPFGRRTNQATAGITDGHNPAGSRCRATGAPAFMCRGWQAFRVGGTSSRAGRTIPGPPPWRTPDVDTIGQLGPALAVAQGTELDGPAPAQRHPDRHGDAKPAPSRRPGWARGRLGGNHGTYCPWCCSTGCAWTAPACSPDCPTRSSCRLLHRPGIRGVRRRLQRLPATANPGPRLAGCPRPRHLWSRRGPAAYLLTPAKWADQRVEFCRLVGKRADSTMGLAQMAAELHTAGRGGADPGRR